MKISHRDFRPPRRSKYVTQPLKRRPTLRILLLAAIGVAVYLEFDTVVASKAFQELRRPGSALAALFSPAKPIPERPVATGLRWAADSGSVDADCASARIDSCLQGWGGLGEEALGTLRASIQKARVQLEADVSTGFTARFLRMEEKSDLLNPGNTALNLVRLYLRGSKDVTLYRAQGELPSPLCAGDRCLDAFHPHAPFSRYRRMQAAPGPRRDPAEARIPAAAFSPLEGSPAIPILRGRVVQLPADGKGWMKIYHGNNIFSYYRGFTELRPELKSGAWVGTGDTLGLVVPGTDSMPALELRIEKDGLPLDPIAFLGLETSAPQAFAPEAREMLPGAFPKPGTEALHGH